MSEQTISQCRVESIRPNPWNRKRGVDDDFVQSVRDNGLLQPIVLREDGDGFQIIAGERRWTAAKQIGMEFIPAIVREADDVQARELCLIENVQRANLSAIDEAQEIAVLLEIHGDDVAEVAARLGRSRSFIRSRAKLAKLDLSLFDGMDIGAENVPVACLELLAKIPEDIQRRIAEETPWAIPNLQRLQAAAQGLTHSVKFAPWIKAGVDDFTDSVAKCANCQKRTGAEPDLFGKADGVIGEGDYCLDRDCYSWKERTFIDGIIAHETLRNPEVVKVARDIPQELYDAAKAQRVQILDAVFRGDVETCRKTDEGSMRAVIWCGEGVGTALYVKAVAKPEDALTVEQRRAAWVCSKIRKALRTVLESVTDDNRDGWVSAMNLLAEGKGEDAVAKLEEEAKEAIL